MSLCKMQLSPSKASAEEHLVTALGHAMSMSKADQLHHLTHALLTKGKLTIFIIIINPLTPVDRGERHVRNSGSFESIILSIESSFICQILHNWQYNNI